MLIRTSKANSAEHIRGSLQTAPYHLYEAGRDAPTAPRRDWLLVDDALWWNSGGELWLQTNATDEAIEVVAPCKEGRAAGASNPAVFAAAAKAARAPADANAPGRAERPEQVASKEHVRSSSARATRAEVAQV